MRSGGRERWVFDFSSLLLKQPPPSLSFFSKHPHAAVRWDAEGCTGGRVQHHTAAAAATWYLFSVITLNKYQVVKWGGWWSGEKSAKNMQGDYTERKASPSQLTAACRDFEKKEGEVALLKKKWRKVKHSTLSLLLIQRFSLQSSSALGPVLLSS